ncbi:MAG: molybdate ABC transporter substrate-binding protein [Caldilineaceae bacterium]|nr:molybdate ABC transporter substrate-binding protein [Caldilineaceae bacterium]
MRQLLQKYLALALILLLAACAPITAPAATSEGTAPTTTTTLTVFAAASLTDAFNEISPAFVAAHPGTEIIFNFAGSNQLATQIGEGAPADVFASANNTQLNVAIATGRIITGTQRTFARNRLVVVTPSDNPAGLTGLQDLATPGIKLVLAAEAVPVGQYSLAFLDKAEADGALGAGYKEAVLANVVSYEENVRAVLTKVSLGEADAGIVYSSDVGAAADEVTQIEIPDNLNTIATYPIAPLADSPHLELAQQFMDYVLAPEGQQVLVKYGFISTTGDASGAAPSAAPVAVAGLVDTPTTFTADDLRALEQATITATNRDGVAEEFTGVLLSTLLSEVGVQATAQSVTFIGGDGYSQDVSLAELTADPDAILVIEEGDALRNVIPTMVPRYWVKGLVTIEVK